MSTAILTFVAIGCSSAGVLVGFLVSALLTSGKREDQMVNDLIRRNREIQRRYMRVIEGGRKPW
jgi:hypothetical protein